MQIRQAGRIRVSVRVPIMPVRWRHHLVGLVLGLAIQMPVTLPRDPLVRHQIRLACQRRVLSVHQHRRREGVVEERVRDEAARVERLVGPVLDPDRVAIGRERRRRFGVALELSSIERLDVPTVVLKEVCETVVEQHRWPEVV